MKTINERNRITWIKAQLEALPKGARILDAGAGEQQFKLFCKHLNYVAQDFAQYNPNDLDLGLQMPTWDYGQLDIISDITSIPEPDNSFDAILCTEVFEHIPNPILAIKEFSRLLKPNGKLIITAPFCSMTHFAPYHFYSGFNRYFYETHFKTFEFEMQSIEPNGHYFDYLKQEITRSSEMAKTYTKSQFNFFERIALKIVYRAYNRFSLSDTESGTLLNFGFHVVAIKK